MSHIPLRKEKDCLNCGAIVGDRFCTVCGQENVVPKESFWHMVRHFFYDITHFDSHFFHTVHHLALKPGFLTKEYMRGKRASYLHPIKMYVFTSAVFFLLFFSVFNTGSSFKSNIDDPISLKERNEVIRELEKSLIEKPDENITRLLPWLKDTNNRVTRRELLDRGFTRPFTISFYGEKYSSYREYDSIQHRLPKEQRDGWLKQRLIRKTIDINKKFREDPDKIGAKLMDSFLHRLPYLLFVSLPLFALFLKLVYIRRKQFYYADHGVFTIHLYIFSFILLMVVFGVGKLEALTGNTVTNLLTIALFIWLLIYLYKAMRRFYGQGRIKTIIKYLLVALLSLVMMLVLLFIFLVFSAVTL